MKTGNRAKIKSFFKRLGSELGFFCYGMSELTGRPKRKKPSVDRRVPSIRPAQPKGADPEKKTKTDPRAAAFLRSVRTDFNMVPPLLVKLSKAMETIHESVKYFPSTVSDMHGIFDAYEQRPLVQGPSWFDVVVRTAMNNGDLNPENMTMIQFIYGIRNVSNAFTRCRNSMNDEATSNRLTQMAESVLCLDSANNTIDSLQRLVADASTRIKERSWRTHYIDTGPQEVPTVTADIPYHDEAPFEFPESIQYNSDEKFDDSFNLPETREDPPHSLNAPCENEEVLPVPVSTGLVDSPVPVRRLESRVESSIQTPFNSFEEEEENLTIDQSRESADPGPIRRLEDRVTQTPLDSFEEEDQSVPMGSPLMWSPRSDLTLSAFGDDRDVLFCALENDVDEPSLTKRACVTADPATPIII